MRLKQGTVMTSRCAKLVGALLVSLSVVGRSQDPDRSIPEPTKTMALSIPSSSTASGRIDIAPDEKAEGVPYDLVVVATSPFKGTDGKVVGPSKVRFLVKLSKNLKTEFVTKANWTRLDPFEVFNGTATIWIAIKVEPDGSILKSQNTNLLIRLETDLNLEYGGDLANILFNQEMRNANAGNLQSMQQVAFYYQYGMGVVKNRDLAMEWYKRAAKLGSFESMSAVGHMYLDLENYKEAMA